MSTTGPASEKIPIIVSACKAYIWGVDRYAIGNNLIESMSLLYLELELLYPENAMVETDAVYIFDYFRRLHGKLFSELCRYNPRTSKEITYYLLFSASSLLATKFICEGANEDVWNNEYADIINESYGRKILRLVDLNALEITCLQKLDHKLFLNMNETQGNLLLQNLAAFGELTVGSDAYRETTKALGKQIKDLHLWPKSDTPVYKVIMPNKTLFQPKSLVSSSSSSSSAPSSVSSSSAPVLTPSFVAQLNALKPFCSPLPYSDLYAGAGAQPKAKAKAKPEAKAKPSPRKRFRR